MSEKYKVKDMSLAEAGRMRIEWAEARMPVLMALRERVRKEQPLAGQRWVSLGCLTSPGLARPQCYDPHEFRLGTPVQSSYEAREVCHVMVQRSPRSDHFRMPGVGPAPAPAGWPAR